MPTGTGRPEMVPTEEKRSCHRCRSGPLETSSKKATTHTRLDVYLRCSDSSWTWSGGEEDAEHDFSRDKWKYPVDPHFHKLFLKKQHHFISRGGTLAGSDMSLETSLPNFLLPAHLNNPKRSSLNDRGQITIFSRRWTNVLGFGSILCWFTLNGRTLFAALRHWLRSAGLLREAKRLTDRPPCGEHMKLGKCLGYKLWDVSKGFTYY